MKIGITQYSVSSEYLDGSSLIQHVSELGLSAVEPFFAVPNDVLFSWSSSDIGRFLAQAEKLSVAVPSTAVGIFNSDSSLVENSGKNRAIELTERALDFTAAVNADVMLLCTYLSSEPNTTEKRKNLLEVLARAEPLARRHNITIALESPLPAPELFQLVADAASDHVGIYYDFGNAIALGFDPYQEISVVAQYLCGVHIKDSVNKLGGLHLGKGYLNISAAIEALRKIGYDRWLMIETPADNNAAVREDIAIVKQFV